MEKPAAVVCHTYFVWLAIAAGIFNLLAIPVLRGAENDRGAMMFFAPLVVGCFIGQIGAMALWLVWSDGPFLRRLALHWGIGVALITCALVGLVLATVDMRSYPSPFEIYELLSVLYFLPIVSLAVQAVHWPLRTHFRWRLARNAAPDEPIQSSPLSILDIFAGTTVVALSLAMIRLIPFPGGSFPGASSFMWMRTAVTATFVSGLSLVVLLPAMIFILRFNDLGTGLASFGGYIALGSLVLVLGTAVISNRMAPVEAVLPMIVGIFASATTASAPLLVLRTAGYRLTWSRHRN